MHVAFRADRLEAGRARRTDAILDRTQGFAERVRIVGLDGGDAALAKTQTFEDRIGKRDGAVQSGDVVTRTRAQQEADAGRTIGERRRDRLEPDLRDFIDLHRDHIFRQAVAMARQRVDHAEAVVGVMDQEQRLRPARLAIGGEQHAQFAHQRIGRRHGIARSAGRTHSRALAAAGADQRIDRNMIAIGRNRAGRTQIEAAAAADDLGARMRAEIFGENNVARLVEGADEIARLEHDAQHRGRIARIGAQIAVAQIGCREQRRTAREIENEIASRLGAVARHGEGQFAARGWRRCGEIVDRHLEGAEIAFGRADRAFHHRKVGDAAGAMPAGLLISTVISR